MKDLVERLLELARADREPERAARCPVDWSAAVEEALLPFEPLYFEKGLGLDTSLAPGIRCGQRRPAAPGGRHFAGQRPEIRRARQRGARLLHREGRRAVLAVTSRGDTIPPQELPKLFKRFYRADPEHRHGEGCGLGLAIAHRIVTAHRGRIWATSHQGINTFYVSLPALRH